MKKLSIPQNKILDYWQKVKAENIDLSITDAEKESLKNELKVNSIIHDRGNIYSGYKSRTEYQISKIYNNIFKIVVYQISNKLDTSKPKDQYYIEI